MTEGEWLTCPDVLALLAEPAVNDPRQRRRLRLFSVACCRRLSRFIDDERLWKCLDASVRYADGKLKDSGLGRWTAEANKSWIAVEQSSKRTRNKAAVVRAHHAIAYTCLADRYGAYGSAARIILGAEKDFGKPFLEEMRSLFPHLLRDIFGNPFRPLVLAPAILSTAITSLAQAAYEERTSPSGELDPARLAVLADALEEAGCSEQAILDHLRGPGPHVRGCWPVDLVLARQ